MADSTSSGFGCDRTMTPEALLMWVGFTITSGEPGPVRCLRTKCSICRLSTGPSTVSSAGICGMPRFFNSLCSMSLSPNAWMVRLLALSSFITACRARRSRWHEPAACDQSKSVFIWNVFAASTHGSTSRTGIGSATSGTSAGALGSTSGGAGATCADCGGAASTGTGAVWPAGSGAAASELPRCFTPNRMWKSAETPFNALRHTRVPHIPPSAGHTRPSPMSAWT
mmetsp:Transcript_67404/g.200404  ORF Transcript_67404/g.200404 Transcript_67404/m.200404 type:complete len:226 (-) Transcript_67404:464-1141(-)